MSRLGVVIVSYNTRELLARALVSLLHALERDGVDGHVIVVDNRSADGSAAMVARDFPQVELHRAAENLGFAGGSNLGMRALGFGTPGGGEADALWLLNPDTEVPVGTPGRLLETFDAEPRAGAVGPRLRYGDGRMQHGAFAFPGLAQLLLDLFPHPARLAVSRLNGRYPMRAWEGESRFEVEMLLGAALMVRGRTIDEVGLLDEGYYMYAEELDWCRRIHAAGWRLYADPRAVVIHHEGQATRQFRDEMFVALWRSRLRYYRKWSSPAYVTLVRLLLRIAMGGRRLALRLGGDADEERRRRAESYRRVAAL